MHEEIEVKFLDVDIKELEKKLEIVGAIRAGETLSKICVFDFPGLPLNIANSWLRLREEFGKISLAYKKRIGVNSSDGSINDEGMYEIEVGVSDFEKTREILFSIGMIQKFEQAKKGIRWKKDDIEFDIDTWPVIPTYLEIEGDSWEGVEKASKELGFDYSKHIRGSANQVFKMYGEDDHAWEVLTFDKKVKKN